jgi:cell fate regulator YaaT (PSP1 superfamily)
MGGLGRCGRPLCCGSWLCEFMPVSIKMAKQQDLPLNPTEISGICGRLLCCLSYENDFYTEVKQRLPKLGRTVTTAQGKGRVISYDVFKETLRVELESEVIIEVDAADLLDRGERPAPQPASPQPQQTAAPGGHHEGQGSGRKKRKRKRSQQPPTDGGTAAS